MSVSTPYPPDAYAENGELWWRLEFHPGKNVIYGAENKIAAWLFFHKPVGSTFTMKELRDALGQVDGPNADEHLNRRMRKLRQLDWQLPSAQEVAGLKLGEYKVVTQGWHPGQGSRPKTAGNVGAGVRRAMFERDGYRCVVCGVGRGEEYPDPPPGIAVMTAGHRIAQKLGGSDDLDNLQTECRRCNEQIREEAGLPETFDEVYSEVRSLRRSDKKTLLQWLRSGQRLRSPLDRIYDRARTLSNNERKALVEKLEAATESSTPDSAE